MKKVLGVISALVIVGSIVLIAVAQQESPQLKNVQVLKDKSYADVYKIMANTLSSGLGAPCSFCHEVKDFSSDAKEEKVTARKMLKMVQDMNQKYLKDSKQVTCYMCHRGKEKPLASASEEKKETTNKN
jgi:hypothetical protein